MDVAAGDGVTDAEQLERAIGVRDHRLWASGEQGCVIDLTTGDFAPLGVTPQSDLWWAPDGRYVMFLFNERLMMYDFETRIAFEVAPGTTMTAFAVRPEA